MPNLLTIRNARRAFLAVAALTLGGCGSPHSAAVNPALTSSTAAGSTIPVSSSSSVTPTFTAASTGTTISTVTGAAEANETTGSSSTTSAVTTLSYGLWGYYLQSYPGPWQYILSKGQGHYCAIYFPEEWGQYGGQLADWGKVYPPDVTVLSNAAFTSLGMSFDGACPAPPFPQGRAGIYGQNHAGPWTAIVILPGGTSFCVVPTARQWWQKFGGLASDWKTYYPPDTTVYSLAYASFAHLANTGDCAD